MSFEAYAQELWHRRASRGASFILLRSPESTQLLARRIVREYAAEGLTASRCDLVAWCQRRGSGRGGRSWSSPAGLGVYATLLRRLAQPAAVQLLPLRVAAALCEQVNVYLGGRCRLKWPNDLVVEGAKLGGVLIDVFSRGDDGRVVVVGFGVNHGEEVDAFSLPGVTSLGREGRRVPGLAEVTVALLEAVDRELEREERPMAVVERYRALSLHRPGERLCCRLDQGPLEGTFLGFDPRGFVRLDVGGEERLLGAGEVLLVG